MYGSLNQLFLPVRAKANESVEGSLVLRKAIACLRLLVGVLVIVFAAIPQLVDVSHGEALARGVSSRFSILAMEPTWRLQDFLSGESLPSGVVSSMSDFKVALTSTGGVGD